MLRGQLIRNLFRIVFISISLLLSSFTQAADYSRLVVFGDSLSDSGRVFSFYHVQSVPPYDLIPNAPYARGGHHFSNGKTWAEHVASALQLPASGLPATLQGGPGNNYAMGGARGRSFGANYFQNQIGWFFSDVSSVAPANALYAVYFGGNDIRDALSVLESDPTGQTSVNFLDTAAEHISWGIERLINAGAREFVIPTVPDIAITPAIAQQEPGAQYFASVFSIMFNQKLSLKMSELQQTYNDVVFYRPDIYNVLHTVVANPGNYSLGNVTDSCINPGVTKNAICMRPGEYLFWDGIHPTTSGHQIMSQKVLESISQ